MRVLLLMRGAPGCGKSTYIEQNGLTQYTLSADVIRAMIGYEFETNYDISAKLEGHVWSILMNLLEERMRKGMFTVIDACHSKSEDAQKYRRLAEKYRYRIYCVDFTDVTPDICKERNAQRPIWKRVPNSAIDNHYARFTQPFPNYVTMLNRDELSKLQLSPMEYGEKYNKVKVFGDLHGCYTVLMSALGEKGLEDDTLYIFCGDYVDRGIETGKLINWMISVMNKPNVIFIEGNHERNLWNYAEGVPYEDMSKETTIEELYSRFANTIVMDDIAAAVKNRRFVGYSKSFEKTTLPLISDIKPKDIRQLYRKLWQCVWFKFNGQKFLITHGGISTMPKDENLYLISTSQMINGTGKYVDVDEVEIAFETTCEDVIQIHGHRNVLGSPVKVSDRTYNLEGGVEMGGELRWIEIEKSGDSVNIKDFTLENAVYNPDLVGMNIKKEITDIHTLIETFRKATTLVNEKEDGHISSFNFSHTAFDKAAWNDITVKARGLFVNTETEEIVARSYNKFFNYGEVPETKLLSLANNLVFPVTAYVKENGYLGILGYDSESDTCIVASKSTQQGSYAMTFRKLLEQSVDMTKVKEYLKENKVSMVFEVIDVENDPHIIEYSKSKVVLLDIIKNDIVFSKLSFEDMCRVADEFGLEHKKKAKVYTNMSELKAVLNDNTIDDERLSGSGSYDDGYIEGYVFEDSNGYMFKHKLMYYKVWKALRGIVPITLKYGKVSRTSGLTTKTANEFYQWLRSLYEQGERNEGGSIEFEHNMNYKIIPLRKRWRNEMRKLGKN